jgi:hypothetical protein
MTLFRIASLVLGTVCALAAPAVAQTDLLSRVQTLTGKIAQAADITTLVPDQILVGMIKSVPQSAGQRNKRPLRFAFYDGHLRSAIEGSDDRYHNALYGSFTSSNEYFLKEAKITLEESDALFNWRQTALSLGKSYFASALRLDTFFRAKRDLIIETVGGMNTTDRAAFLADTASFARGVEYYLRNENNIRVVLDDYLVTVERWHALYRKCVDLGGSRCEGDSEERRLGRLYRLQEENLYRIAASAGTGLEVFEFAARRQADDTGPPEKSELLKAYLAIAANLQTSIANN